MRISTILIALASYTLASTAQAQVPGAPRNLANPNDKCLDPSTHWSTSLFCKANMDFDGDGWADPAPVPAPPAPTSAPVDPLEDFWFGRLPWTVNAKGDAVTCLDGTRPAAWYSKARDAAGNHIESDDWIFYFQGGGSCRNAEDCADTYLTEPGERDETTTATIHDRSRRYYGMLSSSPQSPFAGYNRVVIQKCSFDRFNGFAVEPLAFSSTLGDYYDRRQLGYSIAKAFLLDLRSGSSYWAWDDAIGELAEVSLPPLEDANVVLFLGTSGGAHGLYHNIDRFHDFLDGWAGFVGDVGAIFDSNFMPSLDIQDGDMYSGVRSGTTGGIAWDDHIYEPGGAYYATALAWALPGDESCRAAHSGVDEWTCLDRHHVLANHIHTDFVVLQDQWDSNHCDQGAGYAPDFADGSGLVIDCGTAFDPLAYNAFGEAVHAQTGYASMGYGSSEIGTGADPSPWPTRFFIGLQCARHQHLIAANALTTTLQNAALPDITLGAILADWVNHLGFGVWAAYDPARGWSTAPNVGACP